MRTHARTLLFRLLKLVLRVIGKLKNGGGLVSRQASIRFVNDAAMARHDMAITLACDGEYIALPYGRTSIGIWSLHDLTIRPLEVEGHKRAVSALSFSQLSRATLLCSAADDYIIVWNVERVRAALNTGQQPRGQIIGQDLGHVQYISFSPDDTLVAACVEKEVLILDSKEERLDTCLEGHNGQVTCAEFSTCQTSILVTAGDDRTFKVWDIVHSLVVYQSTIISASPFLSLILNPLQENLVLGTADGQVRVYDLTEGNGFRCLHHLDVDKLLKKIKMSHFERSRKQLSELKGPVTISSRPHWQRVDTLGTTEENANLEDELEVGSSILGMFYTNKVTSQGRVTPVPRKLSFLQQDDSLVSELLEAAPMLVIATTGAILLVNARTLEPCSCFNLQDPIISHSMLEDTAKKISLAGSVALAQDPDSDKVWCIVGSIFEQEVNILCLSSPTQGSMIPLTRSLSMEQLSCLPSASGDAVTSGDSQMPDMSQCFPCLSVLSSAPLEANSPLKSELLLKTTASEVGRKKHRTGRLRAAQSMGSLSRTGQIADDLPLTLHKTVHSSGYADQDSKRSLFQPQLTSHGKQKMPKHLLKSQPIMREYPTDSEPPTQLSSKVDVADRPTAINLVVFSEDGRHLACALANTSAQVFKMPLTGKGYSFSGHCGSVTSAHWSHDNAWLVTASDDRTASVWSLGLPDPVMTLATVKHNFGSNKEGGLKPDKDNKAFTKPVKFAQFYYVDKFLLATCGHVFYLYKYHLDTRKSDIKRYLSNNRYKAVCTFEMGQSQQITAFSAVNSFHSYLALCAGSDKSLEVFDLNVGRSVLTLPSIHTRSVHTICQNEGSSYVSHPSSAYDLFLTSAASDCIKLWDLRSNRCVRKFEGHTNRTYPCGLAFSPCARFIATGSEDRSAYIFDIRAGTYLHKLTGHTDTVSDVSFHPLLPQLVTVTVDGKVRLFTTQ
ncbi:WD repeat-containing protein 27 [Lamellibrachia satsuma]|nr:WD repeat-containing protein 27 [Lamellibrachia satsuma]